MLDVQGQFKTQSARCVPHGAKKTNAHTSELLRNAITVSDFQNDLLELHVKCCVCMENAEFLVSK